MENASCTHDRILAAARKHFARKGYCKSAMADIARDADMSAGNLYHYFESKLDIGEELCREACTQIYEQLGKQAKDTSVAAEIRLRNFLKGELRLTFERLDALPRMVEMAEDVIAKRPEVRESQLRKSRSLLAEILAQGIASREFGIKDVIETARTIQLATTKYRYPQLFSTQTLVTLEAELDELLDLLLNGITSPGEQNSDNSANTLEEDQVVTS